MGVFSQQVVDLTKILVGRATAPEQAGVIAGDNPADYNATDPFRLWVIQIVIIIAMIELLSLGLSRIRQPRVIAEIIGGILLGPSVMGRIPGFSDAIFPQAAMPMLTLTSTIGLVLFLFLVGLEIDVRVVKRNIKSASIISVAGLVVPLGLGAALGVGVYKNFTDQTVNFGYFLLFVAVAIGITAFPVLCRILTELKLLETTVGVVVLSAGVGNDVVGWVLLALTVALVNASTGLTALWVLLCSVGYVILLMYPGRWAYTWLARRTGSLEQGSPTMLMMTVTLIVILFSAFFTDVIGVHPIFGGFLAGLIIPHENGFAISLVEKLEDLVVTLLLPIYFILSGLRTDLGSLNTGKSWGWTFLICAVAFFSKFISCAAAAKATGFNWRESGAIGSLMSCKGLVELIVLNVGLQAKILDTQTFSMFVVHALILTVMTTPLTLLFYPPRVRVLEGASKGKRSEGDGEVGGGTTARPSHQLKTKFAMVLDKIEQLPAAMTLTQLLQFPSSNVSPPSISTPDEKASEAGEIVGLPNSPLPITRRPITIDALRLIELTNRTSAVLKSQEADTLIHNDPVVSVFRTFGYLNRLLVSAALSVVNYDEFPTAIANHIRESDSDMVIIPWCRGASVEDEGGQGQGGRSGAALNPFDGVFNKASQRDQTTSVVYSEFIRKVYANSPVDVALFVDRGSTSGSGIAQHLFLPFFGGPDDRLALSFLVQLCANPSVTATVIKIQRTASTDLTPTNTLAPLIHDPQQTMAAADTVYGDHSTQTRLVSDTADTLLWDQFTTPSASRDPVISSALSRIRFSTREASQPLHAVVDLVNGEISHPLSGRSLVVVTGRSRRMVVESHSAELAKLMTEKGSNIGSAVSKTLGDVGAALIATGANASLLVMQACIA